MYWPLNITLGPLEAHLHLFFLLFATFCYYVCNKGFMTEEEQRGRLEISWGQEMREEREEEDGTRCEWGSRRGGAGTRLQESDLEKEGGEG